MIETDGEIHASSMTWWRWWWWWLVCHKDNFKNTGRTIIEVLEHHMTSRWIGSGLSDRQPSQARAKVECCRSCYHHGCQVKDCSATWIPFSSITGHNLRPTDDCLGVVSNPSAEVEYSSTPADRHEVYEVHSLNTSMWYFFFCLFLSLWDKNNSYK